MTLRYTRAALKSLARMPANTARLITAKIDQYAAEPASLAKNLKQLKGRPGFRLRVGDYRIIFDQEGTVMDILEIGPRGSIYED
nr:type II toxin-antitoxin system RelE/ParE family toxin [Mesorhizobium sp. B2-3-15]